MKIDQNIKGNKCAFFSCRKFKTDEKVIEQASVGSIGYKHSASIKALRGGMRVSPDAVSATPFVIRLS